MAKEQPNKKVNLLYTGLFLFTAWAIYNWIIQPIFFPGYEEVNISTMASVDQEAIIKLKVLGDKETIEYTVLTADGDYQVYRTITSESAANAIANTLIVNQPTTTVMFEPKPEPMGIGTMLLIGVVPVLLLILGLIYFGQSQADKVEMFGKAKPRLYNPGDIKTTLKNVIMNEGEHTEVYDIANYLKNPDLYFKAGAKSPKGVLMYGPPGTGKTLLAKSIAGDAGVPFLEIAGPELVGMVVGSGSSKIKDLFKQATELDKPCIIFIDEIDAVGAKRDSDMSGTGKSAAQSLEQLLIELDGFNDRSQIILIGATNRVDNLDPALLRPGRIDRKVYVGLPDRGNRVKMVDLFSKNISIDPSVTAKTLNDIGSGLVGMSGAEISNIVNESALLAAKDNRAAVTALDLEEAKDNELFGVKSNKYISPEEEKRTAYHEAGHALVALLSDNPDVLYKVTIVPRGNALGLTVFLPNEDVSITEYQLVGKLATLYAGRVAEGMEFGEYVISTGASNDLKVATQLAKSMVGEWGFGNSVLNAKEMNDLFGEKDRSGMARDISEIVNKAYTLAETILEDNKTQLVDLANELILKKTVTSKEVELIVARA